MEQFTETVTIRVTAATKQMLQDMARAQQRKTGDLARLLLVRQLGQAGTTSAPAVGGD